MRATSVALLAALLAAAPAVAESPRSWAIEGSAYVGGFHVGDAAGTITLGDGDYLLRFDAVGAGLVKLLLQWSYELEVTGAEAPAEPFELVPAAYRTQRNRRGKTHVRDIVFENGIAQVRDSGGENPLSPLPADARAGVLDPATAVLAVGVALARRDSCDLMIPVFDGRHRTDLHITDEGPDVLKPSRQYSGGEARRCSFVFRHVIGDERHRYREDEDEFGGEIWFEEGDDPDLHLPVKFVAPIGAGAFVLHIRRKELSG